MYAIFEVKVNIGDIYPRKEVEIVQYLKRQRQGILSLVWRTSTQNFGIHDFKNIFNITLCILRLPLKV